MPAIRPCWHARRMNRLAAVNASCQLSTVYALYCRLGFPHQPQNLISGHLNTPNTRISRPICVWRSCSFSIATTCSKCYLKWLNLNLLTVEFLRCMHVLNFRQINSRKSLISVSRVFRTTSEREDFFTTSFCIVRPNSGLRTKNQKMNFRTFQAP